MVDKHFHHKMNLAASLPLTSNLHLFLCQIGVRHGMKTRVLVKVLHFRPIIPQSNIQHVQGKKYSIRALC